MRLFVLVLLFPSIVINTKEAKCVIFLAYLRLARRTYTYKRKVIQKELINSCKKKVNMLMIVVKP